MQRRSFLLIPLVVVGCSRPDQRHTQRQTAAAPLEAVLDEVVIPDGGKDVLVQLKAYLHELGKRRIATPVDASGAGTIKCLGNAPGKWNLPCPLADHPDVQNLLRRLRAISDGVTLRLDGLPLHVTKTTVDVAIHAVGAADALGWERTNQELDRAFDEISRELRIDREKPIDQNTKISCVRAMGGAKAIGHLVDEALKPLADIVAKTHSVECPKNDRNSGDQFRGVKAISVTVRINVIDANIAVAVGDAIRRDEAIGADRVEVL